VRRDDESLLDYIFNPEVQGMPLGAPEMTASDLSDLKTSAFSLIRDSIGSVDAAAPLSATTLAQLRHEEAHAIQLAEYKQFDQAIASLTACIERYPNYAPAYNNRAQARQLQLAHQAESSGSGVGAANLAAAISDASHAVYFAASQGDLHTLRLALNQRALMRKKAGDTDGALADFQGAAKCGSKFARKEAVKVNPYAAMCNAFLSSQLENLRNPDHAQCATVTATPIPVAGNAPPAPASAPIAAAAAASSTGAVSDEGKADLP
jgi:tetratricopeptide (TPR) repeat protein